MEAWDVVVVGGGVAGLRAAIAASDEGASVTILEEGALGSASASLSCEGLAVSMGETTSSKHAEDTITIGAGACDESVVRRRTASAFDHLAEMERWGLVLRRDDNGLPMLSDAPGHSHPRLATTGDTTGREIHQILEEQCIKRSIPRRPDTHVISLAVDDGSICGVVALESQRGELVAIRAKSVILATDGYQSAWNGDGFGMGSGASLALAAGVELSNLEFQVFDPLCISGSGMRLPFAILGDGATVRSASGGSVEFSTEGGMFQATQAILTTNEQCVVDARVMDRGTPVWYADIAERVSSGIGGEMNEVVIPITPRVSSTLGGIPCGFDGSVQGISGLYAAGDCASSGMHGADMIPGNRLLESLEGGSSAGSAAASNGASGSTEVVDEALSLASSKIAALLHGSNDGMSPGQVASRLAKVMSDSMGTSRDISGLESAAAAIDEMLTSKIVLSDESPIMNTELVSCIRLEGLLSIASAAVSAASNRAESCGSHVRSDE